MVMTQFENRLACITRSRSFPRGRGRLLVADLRRAILHRVRSEARRTRSHATNAAWIDERGVR